MQNAPADQALIHGFDVSPEGQVTELSWQDVRENPAPPEGVRRWLHLSRLSVEAKGWLYAKAGVDGFIANGLLQDDSRPRSLEHEGGFLINLRGVNLNEGAEPEDMISLRMWATAPLVITTQARQIRAVGDLVTSFQEGEPPASSGEVACFLMDRLVARIEPVVTEMDDELSALEDDFLDEGTPAPKAALARFRRTVLALRRYITPQREAITSFIREADDFISAHSKLRLREVHDTITRISEDLDTIRERAIVIHEEIVEQRAEAMNQRLFVLAIISAIFLPLGFLTGLFGINIGGMPGVDSPWAFWTFVAVLMVVTAALLYAFKKMKWY